VKIGHGPATVNGRRVMTVMARAVVSQETCPGWSKLTLFARRSVAIGLAILARLFYCCEETPALARLLK
jgi:hypothetical protein